MKKHYGNLDGLRVISCFCIIAMHIATYAKYDVPVFVSTLVSSWTHFVAFFLMISGFGMFCGYYEDARFGTIDIYSFYTKRYLKLLPFFSTLILIDVITSRSLEHVVEGITEATLVFGMLPNNQLEVIGVGWTLGVIFLFYMLFPFVVYLCWTKRRAWISFFGSIMISMFCSYYFFSTRFVVDGFAARHNFLYCAPWILGGGVVYLNVEAIKKIVRRNKWISFCICTCFTVLWYIIPARDNGISMLKDLVLFSLWLMYAVSVDSKILSSRSMRFLSSLSLEMYLAQMVLFRLAEKTGLLFLFQSDLVNLCFSWIAIIIGLIIFTQLWKCMIECVKRLLYKRSQGIIK